METRGGTQRSASLARLAAKESRKRTQVLALAVRKIILHRVNDLFGNLRARGPVEKRSGIVRLPCNFSDGNCARTHVESSGLLAWFSCKAGCAHFCLAMVKPNCQAN